MLRKIQFSRERIRHPGPESSERKYFIRGKVFSENSIFHCGSSLMEMIRSALSNYKDGAAFVSIDGLKIKNGKFVLPAGAKDEKNVAWYSDSFEIGAAEFVHGTVVIGKKDEGWFAHCHAVWRDQAGIERMGHILCDTILISEDFQATLHIFSGGKLEVALDPETNFSLMRTVSLKSDIHHPNAVLVTIKPHEDLRNSIDEICAELKIFNAKLFGIGSLIGAEFLNSPPMLSDLSEILLLPGASVINGKCSNLPISCVTAEKEIFSGNLLSGKGPILITCELLIIEGSKNF